MSLRIRPAWLLPLLIAAPPARAEFTGEPIPAQAVPADLKPFVEPGTDLLAFESADLDGDGRPDYVAVLQKRKTRPADADLETGQRPLLVLLRQPDGRLKLAQRNDRVVMCSTCGGMMGDPFQGIDAKPKSFTVQHYGGSGWRWSNAYRFDWSRRDGAFQLVRVEEASFHAGDPGRTTKQRTWRPPRDFGKIDLSGFDPDDFKGKGER